MVNLSFKKIAMKNTFKQDGITYKIRIGRMIYKKKTITADDIMNDADLRKELLAMAWKGPHGQRDESEFHRNGIFQIVYGQEPPEESQPEAPEPKVSKPKTQKREKNK